MQLTDEHFKKCDCKRVFNSETFSPHRETNSGLRGVWVYEIGTSPYFTNVAPGEVTELPTKVPSQAGEARQNVYTNGQVKYSSYEPVAEQIETIPIQYQPNQPENPEVVVVDDTEINVDGESMTKRLK